MPINRQTIEKFKQIVGPERLMTDSEDLHVYSYEKFFEKRRYPAFDAIIRPSSCMHAVTN